MLDCMTVDYFLPCDEADRFVPLEIMPFTGNECEVCSRCRTYDEFMGVLDNALEKSQHLYERTLVMQKLFAENHRLLDSLWNMDTGVLLPVDFTSNMAANADILDKYSEYKPEKIVDVLFNFSRHLDYLLSGRKGENMSYVLGEFSAGHLQVDLSVTEVASTDGLDLAKLMERIQIHLMSLEVSHYEIRHVIEKLEPALLTLRQLTRDSYDTMEANDVMSLRVAARLIERSRDALRSLLKMQMESTASQLQESIAASYDALLATWPATDSSGEASSSLSSDGSGEVSSSLSSDAGSGDVLEEWALPAEPPKKTADNHFYMWLSNRIKRDAE